MEGFRLKLDKEAPLRKIKYGNGMAKLGPYVAHMWELYGKAD